MFADKIFKNWNIDRKSIHLLFQKFALFSVKQRQSLVLDNFSMSWVTCTQPRWRPWRPSLAGRRCGRSAPGRGPAPGPGDWPAAHSDSGQTGSWGTAASGTEMGDVDMWGCEAGYHGRHYLHRVAAGGGQGRAAVSADHGVDGVHPGLQLFLVWSLEEILGPITGLQSEHKLLLGVVPGHRGQAVVNPDSGHRGLVAGRQLGTALVLEAVEHQISQT